MEKESLGALLGQRISVEAIAKRFGKSAPAVAYWMKKHGLEAPNREKFAAKGGIPEETLSELVEEGLTIAEIAEAVQLSKTTVRHWLRRYEMTTSAAQRAQRVRDARAADQRTMMLLCGTHGETEFVLEAGGYYRCKRCRMLRVSRRRRASKAILVAEAGGSCRICGYDRYVGALEFHHIDPALKRMQIGTGSTRGLDDLRQEASKCVLLCSNCHAEVEGGIAEVPLKFLGAG